MASILEEAEAEALRELGEEPKTIEQQAEEQATIELQEPSAEAAKPVEPTEDFFVSAEKFLEPAAPEQKSNADIFLGLVSNKRAGEIDESDKEFFNALGDEDQYRVAQARKDIPLDDAQARRIFEVEKSKMPSAPTSWEDWYNLGGDAFDVVKNVAKLGVKVPLGAAEFGRDVVKASDMQVSDEEFDKNLKKAKSSFYSFMSPAFEIPESVLWATEKAKEGGFGWADAAGEKLGLVSPEDRFENWKGRRLVSQAQAEYFREHPTIYGRLLDSPLAKDALSYIAKSQMESPEELAKRTNVSVEEARSQQDAMARQQVDQLTSEMEFELPEENIRVRTAGEFLLPGEVGMGTMGAVSLGFKGTKAIAQGLKYIGKSADEIAEINKAAQALQKTRFAEMMQKRTQRAESVARGATKVEEAMRSFKPITEKATGIIGKVAPPVLGGLAGYSVSGESPMTGILTGAFGGAAARSLFKGTKLGLQIPTFVREVAEARKVAPLGKTFETLGKTAEGSALKAKILSRGGKTIDNILSNSVEYARSGIHGTTLALATGALESADPEEMKQMLADGLAITLGGRALQHIKGKMMGGDPIIAQRERISDDSRIHRRYQESDPETQSNLDQISDFDNAILFRQKKLADSEIELTNSLQSNDAKKIKLAQSMVEANKMALDHVKRANVQTRNEFGREFLKTYANLQDITNGVLKTGQNNVGFNILSTDQIYQKLRNDPANNNVPDADLVQMASQAGFYSNPSQQGLVFDRRKPSIVINADSIRERINLFGESPTEALNHETSHFIDLVPEFQSALSPVRSMLFQNEIRDAAGNIKATTPGIFSKAKLVELFNDGYLRHLDAEGKEAFTKLNKLWDESRGQLDENKVANYMKSELMADLLGEVSSRHLSKDLDSATLAMWDRARIKAKKNLLDRAIDRFYGFGGRGDIVTAANTRAEFPPEAMAAARDAMRQIVALNAEISPPAQEPDMPAISKAQMMKNSALLNRFGKDSPLFKSEFKVKVFDKDGNQIGESMPVTTPNPREGTFQSTDVGMKKLSGYGDIPVEVQGLQVPDGGTLVVSRDLVMQPDGVTPVMYEAKDAKKVAAERKKLITEALDTDDYGTPNRFEPVAEGSETYRGTFTPAQIKAIQDMPESLVPKTLKENMLKVNEAIAKGDGTRFIVDYAAVMNDNGKYQAFSPKMYDLVPIGMHLSKAGNFLVTTISVGRIFDKMRLWNERMPGRLSFWDNNLERTFDDFTKYLNNWQQGKAGETGLDADPQIALQKKNIFNDLLNLYDKGTEFTNLDRTTIPRRKGDPRAKDANRTIMSIRVDHIAELLANENATKLPVNYGFAKINFMPERMEGEVVEPVKKVATQPEQFPTPERGFYSGLQQTIDQKVQGKFASPDQLKAIISNPQNVKAEELKWSGVLNEIDRLSAENQGKVPKDKVMDYLRNEGAVKFEEATLGQNTEANKIAQKYGIEIQKEYEETTFIDKDGDEIDFADLPKELQDSLSKNIPPKYEKYQLPSGENYREVVMTMPSDLSRSQAKIDAINKRRKEILNISKEQNLFKRSQTDPEAKALNDSLTEEFVNLGKQADRLNADIKDGKTGEQYTSSHFPEVPNYVAHMRLNERTDAQGNQGLFVEEFQSDRHQEGREKGYDVKEEPFKPAEIKQREDGKWGFWKDGTWISTWFGDSQEAAVKRQQETYRSVPPPKTIKTGVPDAPFRKDWGVQLFKRALRDAVESGKSWIGWTTGETQAERYDLSKQIGKVVWNEDTKMLTAYDPSQNRTVIQESNITSDKLADYVGKEVAQKLVEKSPDEDMDREISGLDLKIGGEGMKGFYDQILPKEIGKYVSKMGGKVEKSTIDQSEAQYKVNRDSQPLPYRLEFSDSPEVLARFATADEAWAEAEKRSQTPIWKVNITPEMSGKVKGGQLQFMPQRPAEQERIVAATYTDPRTGEVREGVNHKAANPNAPDEQIDRESRYYGFKTDAGRVVDREEAYRIAEESGQLKKATSEEDKFNADRGVLHSNMVEIKPTIEEKIEISPKMDADYMKAVESNDVEAQQKLVDEAANKAGAVEANGEYLMPEEKIPASKFYSTETPNKKTVEKYQEAMRSGDEFPPVTYRKEGGTLFLEDGTHRMQAAYNIDPNTFVFAREIKSSDPVTYDDAGNVIPLSQRFNLKIGEPTISKKPQSSEMIGGMQFMPQRLVGEIPTAKEVLKKPLENLPLRDASTWTEIQKAPVITLKDLIGKKVFPTFADITSAGRVFKGIDSSELLIPIETHGGPEWPLIQAEKVGEETNVWSNQGAGVTTTKAKRADEGAIMLVTLMDKNAHMSNTEVANAIIGTNLAYVRDKRITAKNLKLLNKKIKSEEVFNDFVGIDSPDINDYVAKLPFQGDKSRARLSTILSSKESEELGAANVQRILDEMRSPEFEGGRIGDSVIALQLSKGAPVVKLSDSGGMTHPSYQYAVRGKVIGRFSRPINAEMIYDDFIAQRRAEGKPQTGDRRAIDLAKPVQVITEEIANRIPQTPYKYLKSAQHAKLLKYALENQWKNSVTAKNKGGISSAEFIDTLNSSEAKIALNEYTLDSIKKEIKDGKLNLYQLGDSKVFFGTKNIDPASDYGLDPKDYGFGENEKTLTLVLNAERGTAGMGDAIMMKALSEGVTALDCFAIKNTRYPDGMLPSLYKRFGFEVVGEIPFDPQYYTPQKLADIKLFWKNNGWDESTGLPSVVMMKWTGNENDRTRSLRDIAGKTPTGIRKRTEDPVRDAEGYSERTDIGQGGSAQGGLQQGESGRGGGRTGDAIQGIQLGRGTINAIQELFGMNDAELKNLGINPSQIQTIKDAIGYTAEEKKD